MRKGSVEFFPNGSLCMQKQKDGDNMEGNETKVPMMLDCYVYSLFLSTRPRCPSYLIATAIFIIIEGRSQVFQRFFASKLVRTTVKLFRGHQLL